jgi:hypothetical protein
MPEKNTKSEGGETPEHLRWPWKDVKESKYWEMPEISRVRGETGNEAVKVTLDIDENRINVLNETGIILEDLIKVIKSTFSDSLLKDLSDPEKQTEAFLRLKSLADENSVLKNTRDAFSEFRNIQLIQDFLTPEIYSRLEYVFREIETRLSKIVELLQQTQLNESEYSKLHKQISSLLEFQINATGDVSATVNSFASELKTFGASMMELKELLDDALKIPGYPFETIRAVYTKRNRLPDLLSYYQYYRDSIYSPEEMKSNRHILQGEKEETLTMLKSERFENVRNIIGSIQDVNEFKGIIKRLIKKSDKVEFTEDEEIDFSGEKTISKMMKAGVFENPDVFGFLAEKGVLDDKSVIEALGKLGRLQEKIEIWRNRTIDEMFERKLRNRNFKRLTEGETSFSQMHELYRMWLEVKKKIQV